MFKGLRRVDLKSTRYVVVKYPCYLFTKISTKFDFVLTFKEYTDP
jgi:hypothetical protein